MGAGVVLEGCEEAPVGVGGDGGDDPGDAVDVWASLALKRGPGDAVALLAALLLEAPPSMELAANSEATTLTISERGTVVEAPSLMASVSKT